MLARPLLQLLPSATAALPGVGRRPQRPPKDQGHSSPCMGQRRMAGPQRQPQPLRVVCSSSRCRSGVMAKCRAAHGWHDVGKAGGAIHYPRIRSASCHWDGGCGEVPQIWYVEEIWWEGPSYLYVLSEGGGLQLEARRGFAAHLEAQVAVGKRSLLRCARHARGRSDHARTQRISCGACRRGLR